MIPFGACVFLQSTVSKTAEQLEGHYALGSSAYFRILLQRHFIEFKVDKSNVHNGTLNEYLDELFLPTTYILRGKVMFSVVSVLFTGGRERGYPDQVTLLSPSSPFRLRCSGKYTYTDLFPLFHVRMQKVGDTC